MKFTKNIFPIVIFQICFLTLFVSRSFAIPPGTGCCVVIRNNGTCKSYNGQLYCGGGASMTIVNACDNVDVNTPCSSAPQQYPAPRGNCTKVGDSCISSTYTQGYPLRGYECKASGSPAAYSCIMEYPQYTFPTPIPTRQPPKTLQPSSMESYTTR